MATFCSSGMPNMLFLREGAGKIPDNLPGSLKQIVARCLSLDSANRFSGLSTLKGALLEVYRSKSERDYRIPEVEIDDSPIWWFNRGSAFSNIGRYAAAETPFREALKRFKAGPGTKINQANCLVNLGNVYGRTGKPSDAEEKYREALSIYEAIPGTEIKQAKCLTTLGSVNMDKLSDAEEKHREALSIFETIPGTEVEQATCLTNLGFLYFNNHEYSKARSVLKSALEICEQYPMVTEPIKNVCLRVLSQP